MTKKGIKIRELGPNVIPFPGYRYIDGKFYKDGNCAREIGDSLDHLSDADFWRASAWVRQRHAWRQTLAIGNSGHGHGSAA